MTLLDRSPAMLERTRRNRVAHDRAAGFRNSVP